jgi:hypothetical protein
MKTTIYSARRVCGALAAFLFTGLQAAFVLNAQPCYLPPSGMTNWYRFDASNALNDQTGANPLTGNSGTAAGKVGAAKPFNGTLSSVLTATKANQPSFGSGDFSFDAWVNVPAVDNDVEVLAEKRQTTPLQGWSFYTYQGALGIQIAYGGANWNYVATTKIPLNKWSMIAAVIRRKTSPAKVDFYLNGALVSSATIGATANSANVDTNAAMKLGVRTISDDGFFKGLLDEVELFNRALTAQEIAAIYAAGAAGKCAACPGTDPQIASITVPPRVTTGGDMQYTIEFRNYGSQDTGKVDFNMWLDKSPACTASPAAWTVGQTNNSNIPSMTSSSSFASYEIFVPPGKYYMCWKTDPENKIKECPAPNGETNNLTSTPVNVVAACPGIDLKVGELFTSGSTFSHTQPFTYVIWVFNAGATSASTSFTTQVSLVDKGGVAHVIDSIFGPLNAAGFQGHGPRTVASIASLPPGTYTLRADVDVTNKVAECNETNNTFKSTSPITIN